MHLCKDQKTLAMSQSQPSHTYPAVHADSIHLSHGSSRRSLFQSENSAKIHSSLFIPKSKQSSMTQAIPIHHLNTETKHSDSIEIRPGIYFSPSKLISSNIAINSKQSISSNTLNSNLVSYSPSKTLHKPNSPYWKNSKTYKNYNPILIPDNINKTVLISDNTSKKKPIIKDLNPLKNNILKLASNIPSSQISDKEIANLQPESMAAKLKPHQIIGLKWLMEKETSKQKGGILADEMGLGKTIQMIALMITRRSSEFFKTNLIVVPLVILNQWKDEIEINHKPKNEGEKGLKVLVFHGTKRERESMSHRLSNYDVVLITYQSKLEIIIALLSESESLSSPLLTTKWYRVILDEAHTIKNHNTKTAKACHQLLAEYKWALTGTLIQNSVEDLFSIFKYLNLPIFSNIREFKKYILQPFTSKEIRRKKQAESQLKGIFESVLLRRTKESTVNEELIINLPACTSNIIRLDFSAFERNIYQTIAKKGKDQIQELGKSSNPDQKIYMQALTILLRLKQSCNHFSLLKNSLTKEEFLECQNYQVQDPELDELINSINDLDLYESNVPQKISTKLDCLIKILQKNSKLGVKTVIFSQFTQMLNLTKQFLDENGLSNVQYHGKMSNDKKMESLKSFKSSSNQNSCLILLASLKAMSVGLNLVEASHVIILDLWWNPAIEV